MEGKDEREAAEEVPAGASPCEAAQKGPVVENSELRIRRPDGLRGLAAPLLRGDGNWPSLGLYTSPEARILQGVEGLLACVPFWAQVRAARYPLSLLPPTPPPPPSLLSSNCSISWQLQRMPFM